MPLLQLVAIIIVIGVLLWLANTYIPMQPPMKQIMNAIVIIAVVIWIIALFFPGLGNIGSIRVGK